MTERQNPHSATNTERAESNSAADLKLASHSISGDDRHAAFCAGYETGKAERVDIEIEDQIQIRIHDRVRASLGLARKYAAAKGPAWEAMIVWSGASDD
jgi:hypothetical protein